MSNPHRWLNLVLGGGFLHGTASREASIVFNYKGITSAGALSTGFG